VSSPARFCERKPCLGTGFIEPDRAKWARFCKNCSKERPRDWYFEHPECRARGVYSDDEKADRRKRQRRARAKRPEHYREKSREYQRRYRLKKKLLARAEKLREAA
jgi:hypothetical protein